MTDYTDLIARLRSGQFTEFQRTKNAEDITYPSSAGKMAADALEAQARRIAELEEDCEMRRAVNFGQSQTIDGYVARIAELKAALKIKDANGHPVTTVMGINSKLTAALESRDARIAELEAALKPFADVANYFDNEPRYTDEDSPCEAFNTFADLRAARAAYRGEKND